MRTSAPARPGYVLFEVILALTIFAIAVVGLTQSLNISLEAAGRLNRENAIRIGLRSFIEETRRKEVADMATESRDDRLGVTFSSTVEELAMKNVDGKILNGLYALHAKASWGDAKDGQEETVDLYLYKPQITPGSDSSSKTSGGSSSTTAPASASNSGQPQSGGAAPARGTSSGGGAPANGKTGR